MLGSPGWGDGGFLFVGHQDFVLLRYSKTRRPRNGGCDRMEEIFTHGSLETGGMAYHTGLSGTGLEQRVNASKHHHCDVHGSGKAGKQV